MIEMQYKGIKFNAVIATPGCGKSYLSDRYDFVIDADELKLKNKYIIPRDITRDELEKTKGNRKFEKNKKFSYENIELLLDNYLKQNKLIIGAPHNELFNYFQKRGIKFCFVYPNKKMKRELVRRFKKRKNPKEFIKLNKKMFYKFYKSNKKETRACVCYEFGKNEYLEDILQKFGVIFK